MTTTAAAVLRPVWTEEKTKEQKLQEWLDAAVMLKAAKDLEMLLRKAVVTAFPFDIDVKEGTQRIPLANGYELKVVKKQNYNLNNKEGATDKALTLFEQSSPEAAFIADRLVKWSPELSITEYRLLTPAQLKYFENVLTITDGAPALELVEPKAK